MRCVRSILATTPLATACMAATATHKGEQPASGSTIQLSQGHFSKTNKAFHYSDREPAIPAVCSKCHAADGLATAVNLDTLDT